MLVSHAVENQDLVLIAIKEVTIVEKCEYELHNMNASFFLYGF